jgi:hypothetical protein
MFLDVFAFDRFIWRQTGPVTDAPHSTTATTNYWLSQFVVTFYLRYEKHVVLGLSRIYY